MSPFRFLLLQEHNTMSSSASKTKVKILLVEDVELIRKVVRAMVVKQIKLEMEEAENGQAAVDYFSKGGTCDLVLMDGSMPVMNGHEATKRLRSMGVKTPIVAVSSDNKQSDQDLFLKAGANEFQSKPLSEEKLVQVLARYGLR